MVRRLWLTPFPLLAAIVGAAYALGDPARYANPTFDPARELAPIQVWGWVFLLGAVVLTATLLAARRTLVQVALVFGGGVYTFWAVCFAVAAIVEPAASLAGWAKELCLALAHFYAAWRVRTNPRPA